MNSADLWLPFVLSLPMILYGGTTLLNLFKSRKANLIRVYLLAFVLQFGIMPLYGFLIGWSRGSWPFQEDEMFRAYLNLYIFIGGVLCILLFYDLAPKKFRRGWTIPQLLKKQYADIPLRKTIVYFLIIIGFLIGFNIYFGYTSYASGTLERNLSVPYPLVIAKSFSTIFVCGLIGYGALHLILGKKYLLIGLLLILSNNFLDLYSRRKYILVILLLILIKIMIDRWKVTVREIVVVSAAVAFLLAVFFPFLFVFRQLTVNDPKNGTGNMDINETYEIAQSSKGEQLGKGLEENEAYRTNQIARNIEYMRYPDADQRYMNGLLFAFQASQAIPRALYPDKIQTGKVNSPESIIFFFYGRKGFDMTDNLPVYGYLEFGYWGAFIIGVFQAVLLVIFEWFAFRFQRIHSFWGLSVLIYAIYNHLNIEYHYISEISSLRELILLYLLVWPISLLLKLTYSHKRYRNCALPV